MESKNLAFEFAEKQGRRNVQDEFQFNIKSISLSEVLIEVTTSLEESESQCLLSKQQTKNLKLSEANYVNYQIYVDLGEVLTVGKMTSA